MKKTFLFIILALISIICTIFIFTNNKVHQLEREVLLYLEKQGYDRDDIQEIKGKISKAPLYNITVIFKDEPRVQYHYTRLDDQGIRQYDATRFYDEKYNYKHLEPHLLKYLQSTGNSGSSG